MSYARQLAILESLDAQPLDCKNDPDLCDHCWLKAQLAGTDPQSHTASTPDADQ